jgi:MOSC domain-containing protein YiiM
MKPYILQLNIKGKNIHEVSLPKKATRIVSVKFEGLEGDLNQFRFSKKKNDLNMAVMILTTDIIEQLNNEGWPVMPGDLGENLTIENINYNSIQPGQCYQVGSVKLEISIICAPCNKLKNLTYVGESKKISFIKTLINRRGWYARVLKEGKIQTGDSFKFIK